VSRRYEGEDYDEFVDRVTDEAIQNDVDDGKKNASQTSPEILSLQDAFIEGQRAGQMGLSAGLNPWQDGYPEHNEWLRGWRAAIARRAA
jgi:ribosome modulation factor